MEINAREISDLDPGAIPGGSTTFPDRLSPEGLVGCSGGPISFDRRVKAWLSPGCLPLSGFF